MRAAVAAAQVCLLQHGFLRQERALEEVEAPRVADQCAAAIKPFPPAGVEASASFCRVDGQLLFWASLDGAPFGAACGDIWVGQPPCCDALVAAAEAQCGGAVLNIVECVMDTRVWTGGGTEVETSPYAEHKAGVLVKQADAPFAVQSPQFEFAGKSLLCSIFNFGEVATTTTTTPAPAPGPGSAGLPLWHAAGVVAGGGPPDQAATKQTTTTSLNRPSGLAFNGETMYVADTYNHRIVRFPPGATEGTVVAGNNGPGAGADKLWNPVGVAVDGETIYAACLRSGAVVKWTAGRGAGEVVLDGLFHPAGLALLPGLVYVADAGDHRVVRYALATKTMTVVAGGSEGHGLDQLRGPQGLALDAPGNLYVADSQNHRVLKFAPGAKEGVVVAGTGESGTGLDRLHTPTGVTVDGAGTVIVVEGGNPRVTAWAPGASAGILLAGGAEGSGADQLARHPLDVKLDPAGALFIADRDNNRIVKWAA